MVVGKNLVSLWLVMVVLVLISDKKKGLVVLCLILIFFVSFRNDVINSCFVFKSKLFILKRKVVGCVI